MRRNHVLRVLDRFYIWLYYKINSLHANCHSSLEEIPLGYDRADFYGMVFKVPLMGILWIYEEHKQEVFR